MEFLSLTLKQIDILLLLYKFRFLNRCHIQLLLQHKEPRRIKAWLKELYANGYVGRIYSRTRIDMNTPAVYYLSLKARLVLKNQKDINQNLLTRVYRERLRSKRFIDHHLFLADFYLGLDEFAKTKKQKLHYYAKTYLTGMASLIIPVPDAYIAFEITKKNIDRYFLDLIDEGVPRFVLRKRIKDYLEYCESEEWQQSTTHPFPKVLLICPNELTRKFLNRFILRALEESMADISFFLTTKDQIKLHGIKKEIWKKVGNGDSGAE